jgi:glutaredoxin-like YruB-family protein
MRVALAFLVVVLLGAAGLMYTIAWRMPDDLGDTERTAAGQPAPAAESEPSLLAALTETKSTAAATAAPEPAPEVWYQYTDERGSVRFASSLDEVPPAHRARAGRMEMSTPIQTLGTPAKAARPTRRARRRAAVDDQVWGGPRYTDEVVIYTTSWCGYCRKAMAHLDAKGIDYENKDIEADSDAEAEYLEKSGGRRGVPLIDVGGQIMQGYSRERLDQMLANLS